MMWSHIKEVLMLVPVTYAVCGWCGVALRGGLVALLPTHPRGVMGICGECLTRSNATGVRFPRSAYFLGAAACNFLQRRSHLIARLILPYAQPNNRMQQTRRKRRSHHQRLMRAADAWR